MGLGREEGVPAGRGQVSVSAAGAAEQAQAGQDSPTARQKLVHLMTFQWPEKASVFLTQVFPLPGDSSSRPGDRKQRLSPQARAAGTLPCACDRAEPTPMAFSGRTPSPRPLASPLPTRRSSSSGFSCLSPPMGYEARPGFGSLLLP